MFSNRILLMRPALYAPIAPQIRAFSLARIALLPARVVAPPPPPAKGRKTATTAKAPATTAANKLAPTAKKQPASKALASKAPASKAPASKATKQAAPAAPAPAKRIHLTDKERAARDKAKVKEKEKLAKEREKEKERKAKEKEKEKELKAKEREKEREKKEKEKLREAAKQERLKRKVEMAKALKKPYPPAPKRPRSGYVLFMVDKDVKRERGNTATRDATFAGLAWKALSEAERQPYEKKAKLARDVWKEEVAKWVSTLNLAQLKAARANREPGTRDDTAMNALPKRPANKYALFLADVTSRQDFREKVDAIAEKEASKGNQVVAQKKIGLFGRATADLWKTMSEKEKAVYEAKAAEAKEDWIKRYGDPMAAQREKIAAAFH